MSHFYGILNGSRGMTTRCGTKNSGITATAMSWSGCVKLSINHSDDDGLDHYHIEQTQHPGNGAGVHQLIAYGVVGELKEDKKKDYLVKVLRLILESSEPESVVAHMARTSLKNVGE